ncbi:unnamed protein product [Dracunculus medinensis]|uniref:rRNA adenine N(6)-methyltransferase n=1 Tax=Dracunculus medinensis TaxID=318479 RepID=A0A0N4UD04_DRAME|nr:unnamed protein product [Dracunculus medinensis]
MAKNFSRLPPLPALRDFIYMYNIRAKKLLSQNFLMDMNLTRKIVRKAEIAKNDFVIEVGPGPGGITRALLETDCQRLDVIEVDQRFLPALRLLGEISDERLHIHHGDILKMNIKDLWTKANVSRVDWLTAPPALHIIGNLPFNIATPLIIKFLREMHHRSGPWYFGRVPLTLTFQMEVARRLIGLIDSDDCSRISIMSNFITEPKLLFKIPGCCFVPKPKVDVGVVKFIPRKEPLIECDFDLVEKLCRHVFIYRRKYCIKTLYPKEISDELAHELLSRCRISPKQASFQLGVEQFADLCLVYEEQCKRLPGLFLYDYTKPDRTVESLSNLPNAIPPKYPFSISIPSCGVSLFDSGAVFHE